MSRPTYVYRVIVDRFPDWCPDGWDRLYSDSPRFGQTVEPPPRELRDLADRGLLPHDMNAYPMDETNPAIMHLDDDIDIGYDVIVCPRRDRVHWLSAAAAHRWVRHAIALGAEVHLERGTVTEWVRP